MIDTGTATGTLQFINADNENDGTTEYIGFRRRNELRRESLKSSINDLESTTSFDKSDDDLIETISYETEPIQRLRDIYFDDFISPELKTSVHILEISQQYISNALVSIKEGKKKESDEYIMEFKSFLPELFCCRTISESFGAVINSIANALTNMKGAPLSENQLQALYSLITALLREPAMSFQKAVEIVSDFEDADFEVTSIGVDSLLRLVETMDNTELDFAHE